MKMNDFKSDSEFEKIKILTSSLKSAKDAKPTSFVVEMDKIGVQPYQFYDTPHH